LTCLFQFGIDLLRPMPGRWAWLRWLPVSSLLVWSLGALVWLTVMPVSLAEWQILANIWARYLIGLPGAALAAYGLRCHAARLIAPFSEKRTLRMLYLAAWSLAGYAVLGGLVVPAAPYFPANWLNTTLLESWLIVPTPVWRSLLGLMLTLTILRTLEIFDLEIEYKLNAMEEAETLAVERERIGRDLHDRTLQSVYAAGLMLRAASEKLRWPEEGHNTAGLNQAMQALDQAVNDIRQHIAELRAQPTSLSLAEGLTQLLRDSALPSMVEVDLTLNLPEDQPLSAGQVSHLLAITREALSNVARHAHAHQVQLCAQLEANSLHLAVTDDGHGIPPDYVAGYGLRNMRDRAKLLGGELEIYSEPGHGTRLRLTLPWETETAL